MIGTQHLASVIARMPLNEDYGMDWTGNVPDGFTYLSSGSYRHAFLGPDGVVYKRETSDGIANSSVAGNLSEWENYCKAPTFPGNIRLALTHLWEIDGTPIIAMEYVKDKTPELSESDKRSLRDFGIWDCYGNNVRRRGDEIIVTDFTH